METQKTILILSNEPWGDIWYSKQHYANELSKLNHKVYFINAPTSWSFKNLFFWRIHKTKIKENLWVIEYKNFLPVRFFPSLVMKVNDFINRIKLKYGIGYGNEAIQWTFDPLRFIYFTLTKKVLFHVVDPYMMLPSTKAYAPILANKSHHIICSSSKYIDYYTNFNFKNLTFIPHMISEEEFDIDKEKVEEYLGNYGKYILFIGTINRDVNISLFESILAQLDTNLVIIGKESDDVALSEEIKNHPMCHYLGVKHAKELKNYISAAQVCVTAYDFVDAKVAQKETRSPLKVLNYLSQKKPVVTSINSEIEVLEGKGVFWAKNEDEYIALLEQAIQGDLLVDKDAVESYLAGYSYPKAIDKIFKVL